MAVINSVAFWAPGTLYLPGDDGKRIEIKFRARFKRLKKSERTALEQRVEANKLTKEMRTLLRQRLDDPTEKFAAGVREFMEATLVAENITDSQFLAETLVDLDIKDTEGQPIIYTPAVVAQLEEELDGFEGELVRLYVRTTNEGSSAQGAEKNSGTRSGTTSN